jgi:hypothetical protein
MIRISVKGLAKFMTSGPSAQRKILRDFKYPDEDEPSAMRLYYRDATKRIYAFHKNSHDGSWLIQKAKELTDLASAHSGRPAARLRHNARALRAYEQFFGSRKFIPQGQLRLSISYGQVSIAVSPDLYVEEKGKLKLVKLEFGKDTPSQGVVKIVSQLLFEAGRGKVPAFSSSSVLYLDVPRGAEHKGARAGSRAAREIEDACKNIEQLWPGI